MEHVHVLEEAKRVTDRQLDEARLELQRQDAYIRSLEKSKSRMMSESEDTTRERDRQQVEIRTQARAIKSQEEKVRAALKELDAERRAREQVEVKVKRLQSDLQLAHTQVNDTAQQLHSTVKAKENLEQELTKLADEADTNSVAKVQRQYESKISQLESQLEEALMSQDTAARIKEQVDRQHQEIRRLIMSGPKDDAFRSRIMRELQLADEEMERAFLSRSQRRVSSDVRSMANVTPTKRPNGILRVRKDSAPSSPRPSDKHAQVSALKREVQLLELQMAASTRVRHYLENLVKEMTSEMETSDGSKQSLEQYRSRLAQENAHLNQLLQEEAEARREAEAAQLKDIQTMWQKFQTTLLEERESYSRLEESRKALVCGFRLVHTYC